MSIELNVRTELVKLINERDRLRYLPACHSDEREQVRHDKRMALEQQIQACYRQLQEVGA